MNETRRMMSRIAILYDGQTTDPVEICRMYQETRDDVLLSYLFCKWHRFTCKVANMYPVLVESDKASMAVEELQRSMLDYNFDGGASPMGLFGTYLRNRYRNETTLFRRHRRRLLVEASSLNELQERDDPNLNIYDTSIDDVNVDIILHHPASKLTKNEIRYCEILLADRGELPTGSDAARQMGVSPACITYIRRSLEKKLTVALSF